MSVSLPPYGQMPKDYLEIPPDMKAPDAWNSAPEIQFSQWIEAVADLLKDKLWPRFNGNEWVGAAKNFMTELTNADFKLFITLREEFDKPVWPGCAEVHSTLFEIEDLVDVRSPDKIKPPKGTPDDGLLLDQSVDRTLAMYLYTHRVNTLHAELVKDYIKVLHQHSGEIDLYLKFCMQRPRAYQVALIMNKTNFTHVSATSALTPSLISAHCFQMMTGGIAAYLSASSKGAGQATLDAIGKHMVDAGDRRVMAGVHYPSDNISSWITTFLAHPFIFGDQASREWAWSMIKGHSLVYKTIESAISSDEPAYEICQVYRPAWELLEEIATTTDPARIKSTLGLPVSPV